MVAAVYVDKEISRNLLELGVADSKKLTDKKISELYAIVTGDEMPHAYDVQDVADMAEDAIDAHSKLHEPQGQAIAMTDTEVSRTRDSRAEHDVGEEVWY